MQSTYDVLDLRELAREMIDLETDDARDHEDEERLADLRNLAEQITSEGTSGALMTHGDDYEPTLIEARGFVAYAEELANDLGYLDDDKHSQWPFSCIDWERAAKELRCDYTTVDFDEREWLIRST